jgi:phage terminase large subunit-like protein
LNLSSPNTSRSERYEFLHGLTFRQALNFYRYLHDSNELGDEERRWAKADMGRDDRFYLLTHTLNRHDAIHPWLYERCREVEANPDGYLDLWAREHYKSSIITFAGIIQEIIKNPEITIGIFSHTRPIAKGFLRQIKREMEGNPNLLAMYPHIFWENARRDAPKWSEDDGIIVKRKTNPKEATIEAHGLVDGQPTSKHFALRVYDDVVTRESVTTADQIKTVSAAWELSLNLGTVAGKEWYLGTRYHANDTYRTIIERKAAIPRIYPATNDGTEEGEPVLMPADVLTKKRRDMGPYTFGCQMMQNPSADRVQGFKLEWLRTYSRQPTGGNCYLICDPAGEKKKDNDYTVQLVIMLCEDENYYLVDGIRSRLNLTERTESLVRLHRKWRPIRTGYEKYGKDSDIEHIRYVQEQENYRFEIVPLGGPTPKNDRIRKLIPIFEAGRFWLPNDLKFVDHERRVVDLVQIFLSEEYSDFPVSVHDDIFDCTARITDSDMMARFPTKITDVPLDYMSRTNSDRDQLYWSSMR